MNYVKVVFCFAIISVSSQALALGTSPWTKVIEIIQGPGSFPLIKIANFGDSDTGCTSSGAVRFNDVDNSVAGKRHFSTLLSALAAGKDVRITTNICSSDYPYIEYVYIRS